MNTQQAIEVLYQNGEELISSVYDNDQEVADALTTLIQGFEYPDHSHKTCYEALMAYFVSQKTAFELGRLMCNRELHEHAQEQQIDLVPFFHKHSTNDFGNLDIEDKIENFMALTTGEGRVLSKYKLKDGKDIYVITDFECEEQPRMTTAMFTDDY